MSGRSRVLVALWSTAALLAAPWAAEWVLNRFGIRSSAHLGAPSIRFAHHHNRRHHA
jgi:hypothetical protein